MKRTSEISRSTKETEITVKVNLDGNGVSSIDLEPAFLRHMLQAISTHSLIDINVLARGDLSHHIIEDTAIVLGQCIRQAMEEGPFIRRFGYAMVPMDCSRAQVCIDLGKRPSSVIDLQLDSIRVEDMKTEDIRHFFSSLAQSLGASLHIVVEYGENDHHKAEAVCKALALSLRQGIEPDSRRRNVPSSKGVL